MAFTVLYLAAIVLVPLAHAAGQVVQRWLGGFLDDHQRSARHRVVSADVGASFVAACVNGVFGIVVAWVLVRYDVPGPPHRRCADRPAVRAADGGRGHHVDEPVCAERLVRGSRWRPTASRSPSRPLGITIALIFIGLPFVVRTLQPVIEDLDARWRRRRPASAPAACRCSSACPAQSLPGLADRVRAGVRAGGRRVRLGRLHFRQHADADRDRAAADRRRS